MPSDFNDADVDPELVGEALDLVGFQDIWRANILHAAVVLGLFEVVDSDPKPADTIAEDLGTDPEFTYRLLRGLAHYGVMDGDEDRRFRLTDLGKLFEADHPRSVSPVVRFHRSDFQRAIWQHLPAIVTDGGPTGAVMEYGLRGFEYMKQHPELAQAFNETMSVASQLRVPQIIDTLDEYDFSALAHVCDIGGGHGYLLCRFLNEHPHLEGTVLDLPMVVEERDRRWAPKLGVEDRCAYVAGDMFESVPQADGYFMKWVLHDWADDECMDILRTVHENAPTEGRLFVVETLMPPPGETDDTIPSDILMMVGVGGRERTLSEYQKLVARSGWVFTDTWEPKDDGFTVIEARKR